MITLCEIMSLYPKCGLTLSIKESRNTQLVVGNVKGIVEIIYVSSRLELCEVDEVWPMGMDESIETQTTPPWTWTTIIQSFMGDKIPTYLDREQLHAVIFT